MESILRAVEKKEIPIRPAVVISNREDARGLDIAKGLGVDTEIVPSAGFDGTRWDYDRKIIRALQRHGVCPTNGLVCLAGFMRIISPQLVKRYKNKILNIHPALLPSFPGLNAQRQALEHGVKYSGCTVHIVDAGMDSGPVVMQSAVRVMEDDTEESLSKRILRAEHRIYPMAVDLFARNKVRVVGRRVIFQPSEPPKKYNTLSTPRFP